MIFISLRIVYVDFRHKYKLLPLAESSDAMETIGKSATPCGDATIPSSVATILSGEAMESSAESFSWILGVEEVEFDVSVKDKLRFRRRKSETGVDVSGRRGCEDGGALLREKVREMDA